MTFKTGIYYNIPFDEYQSVDAVHKSMFKSIMRSGKELKHYIETENESSKAMDFGNLVDTLLFEREKFIERYIVPPETYISVKEYKTKPNVEIEKPWNWNADACRKWRDELPEGLTMTSDEDINKAKDIVSSIYEHPLASEWLEHGKYQVSLFWIDPETGLQCKARPDIVTQYNIPDLKVSYDCHPKSFSKTLNNFMYHAGAAFYHDGYFLAQGKEIPEGLQSMPMSFIVAEDKSPYDVVCYQLGDESFEVGRSLYHDALQRYKDFKDNDEYPGYSNVCEEIEIPGYALNKYQLEGVVE